MSAVNTLIFIFLVLLFTPFPGYAINNYVGSEKCAECHESIYADWHASGHHQQLRSVEKAEHANLPLPEGYSWEDISYVIGGVNTKALYIDKNGYIITSAKNGTKAKTSYHLASKEWSFYFPGEKKAYDCGQCHTTDYSPKGHQNNMKGIVGTWREDGIGCEACHGPSSEHAESPIKSLGTADASQLCEQCHQRGGIDQQPLGDLGLDRHHEQINELKAGAHKGLSCVNCHNPHRKASQARDNCTICHSRLYHTFKETVHGKAEIKCFECHMPRASQNAISRARYTGETRIHLFKINTDKDAEMFKLIEEGKKSSTFTEGFVTVDIVCLSCHGSQDKDWAAKEAKNFHSKTMSLQ